MSGAEGPGQRRGRLREAFGDQCRADLLALDQYRAQRVALRVRAVAEDEDFAPVEQLHQPVAGRVRGARRTGHLGCRRVDRLEPHELAAVPEGVAVDDAASVLFVITERIERPGNRGPGGTNQRQQAYANKERLSHSKTLLGGSQGYAG